jgi:rhodopsin domain-containing protein
MVSDLMFAIMPMFFTWKLKRSLIERTLVTLLLALGLCATATGAVRLHYQIEYNKGSHDFFRKMAVLFAWCRVEECVLIVAACMPFLKSQIERIVARLIFKDKTGGPNSVHTISDISNTRARYGSWKCRQSQDLKRFESGHVEVGHIE